MRLIHKGLGLCCRKQACNALMGWEPHGPRILTATFRTKKKKIKMNVIQCYAPTNDSEEKDKDQFYNRLQNIVENFPDKDINIVMGDFNAKVGSDNTGYEQAMGIHGLGEMNENGERFSDLCALNNLVIGGTIFPHKRIHKSTWISPDHVTENQIDHICTAKKFRRSLQDVKVKRGADVASDHHLVVAKLKLKLKRNWMGPKEMKTRYNISLLRDVNTKDAHRHTLKNKYQVLEKLLEDEVDSVNNRWQKIKEAVKSTCLEVLGPMKQQQKEWISAETLRKIQERKQKKSAVNNSKTRTNKV